jgi:4-coumarate--CoA ligase
MNSTNTIDIPPLILGTSWACGVVTPANPTYEVDALTFQLKDSGAKALATIVELLPIAIKAAANAGIPKNRIILLGDQRQGEFKHWRDISDPITTMKWMKGKVNPEKDLAFLVYSSGTTGYPKGVMLSHRNVTSSTLQVLLSEGGNLTWENDSIIAFLPFFHIYGLICRLQFTLVSQNRVTTN